MKKNPARYTISKRKDCKRWQLQVRDRKPPLGYGLRYIGLFKTKEEAINYAKAMLVF